MPAGHVHQLSRTDARRVAVRAQLLTAERPTDLVELVRHLTLLQIDPTAAVAPNADLVAWSRLGYEYDPADLVAALEEHRLVELLGLVRPAEDIVLFRDEMAAWPGRGELRDWQERLRDWVAANDRCRADILARLDSDGPLTSRAFPDTCEVPWRSSGWTDHQNVTRLLEQMVQRGEVAVAGRHRRERLWDLAERVYPDSPPVPWPEAKRLLDERRLRALGIARPRSAKVPMEPNDVGLAGEEAVVEGVKGTWRVDPTYLDQPLRQPSRGRTALLSPFDRLHYDRRRMAELFEFDYQLEMYKPATARRWGYFALPVLHGDRLVGKLDATADRKRGVLRVHALHEDEPFPADVAADVHDEIGELARWLELDLEWD
jgi:uncharacterized protein YcaQ